MPWLDTTKKSTPTAKDIIGMESDELKAKLDSAATKEDLTALQTTVTSSLAELQQTLKGLKTEPTTTEEGNEPPPDGTIEMLTDPQAYMSKNLAPLVKSQLETRAQVMEMRARQNPELAKSFEKFGAELIAASVGHPVETRAQEGYWAWHIRTMLGDKVLKGDIREGQFPSLIGSSSIDPAIGSKAGKDPKHGFSQLQVDWMKEHKIPIDSAAAITRMYDDGEPITQAGYKVYKEAVTSNA